MLLRSPAYKRFCRLGLVAAACAILGVICLRSALARAEVDRNTAFASRVWPDNESVLRANIMSSVTDAARRGTSIGADAMRELRLLSIRAPLDPQPYAVQGAIALRRGRYGAAEQLFLQARQRDPRDPGVRFLLAEVLLRERKDMAGVQELLELATLSPALTPSITAMLASDVSQGGDVPRLRFALENHPAVQDALFSKLAEDASNTDLVVALAGPVRPSQSLADWQAKLLRTDIDAGEFGRALALWRQFSGSSETNIGDFGDSEARSPFTWTLLTSSQGVATPANGGLDVDYFGQRDVSLASRTVVLPATQYELRYQVLSAHGDPSSLHWRVDCLQNGGRLLDVAIPSSPGTYSSSFGVPTDCPAQRISLDGLAAVYPGEVTVSIAQLQVTRRQ